MPSTSRDPFVPSLARRLTAAGLLLTLTLSGCSGQPVDQSPPPPPPPGPPPPLPPPPPPAEVTLTAAIDTLVRFQEITGWEAVASVGESDNDATPWAAAAVAMAVHQVGINRLRLQVRSGAENPVDHFSAWRSGALSDAQWRARRYETVNDNADPNVINPAGFQFTDFDRSVERVVVPMRQLLAARGEQLFVNLTYVSFNDGGALHGNPAEYAEFILATFQHLQGKYGFVPDAVEMILEPDNGTIWNGTLIGQALAATATRLAAAGYQPEFIAPSTLSMSRAVPYFDQVVAVPGAAGRVSELSYHRYAGVSTAALQAIAARAAAAGTRTAMLEHIGSGADDLHADLTIGQASAWEQFSLAYPTSDNGAQYLPIQSGQPVLGSRTRGLRQYFLHVRAGARRVQGSTDRSGLRVAAFTNVGGGPVVVLHLAGSEVVRVTGLRPGRYEVTSSSPSAPILGEATVGGEGELRFASSVAGVVTVAWKP